jgi:hypothetical protein
MPSNGYRIFTPENCMLAFVTTGQRGKPETDGARVAFDVCD